MAAITSPFATLAMVEFRLDEQGHDAVADVINDGLEYAFEIAAQLFRRANLTLTGFETDAVGMVLIKHSIADIAAGYIMQRTPLEAGDTRYTADKPQILVGTGEINIQSWIDEYIKSASNDARAKTVYSKVSFNRDYRSNSL